MSESFRMISPETSAAERLPFIEVALEGQRDEEAITEVIRKAQLEAYPNKELGITREDIQATFDMGRAEEEADPSVDDHKEDTDMRSLVAKDGDKIVGHFLMRKNEDSNQIVSIYILPEYQKAGVGRVFWKETEAFFDPKKETIVYVLPYNTGAISYYKKLGFEETGIPHHEGPGMRMESGAYMPVPVKMVMGPQETAR